MHRGAVTLILVNGPSARKLELPLLVRSSLFSFFFILEGRSLVCLAPFSEEKISNCLAHGPFIRVFTVTYSRGPK